jgi:glycerol-3-phosphate dehydrogenase
VTTRHYDVVVVGGGINGVGVAQAAAAAGHSVLLLEKQGLAAGTSSKSSKLIHGGLRYLESYEFGLVRESLEERELLLKLAPELVQWQDFCVPLYKETRRSPLMLRTGLSLYYLLSGLDADARFASLPRRLWDQLDGLRTDGLRAIFTYKDAQTNDALLTAAVMRSAQSLGAELACPAQFCGAALSATGCHVKYRAGEQERSCSANVLVNAAGPWVNDVAQLINPQQPEIPVELVQGTHIVLPDSAIKMSGNHFFYVESVRDGRAIFIMPREGGLMIGTTETRYRENPDQVRPLPAEESYLLGVLHYYFPLLGHLNRADLASSWAGLRVLPGGAGHAFHRSRETILHPDRHDRPRVLTIYGGKLTSYRATAEKVIERIKPSLEHKSPLASTRELILSPE